MKRTALKRGKAPRRSRMRSKPSRHAQARSAAYREFIARGAKCAVPGCDLDAQSEHHPDNRGTGFKDETVPKVPLCHDHHTGANGVHTLGKLTWRERYWPDA